MSLELESSVSAYKTLSRIFCLQLLSLLLFAYGLFFFHKQLSIVSNQDLQKFISRDEWFEEPQHETVALFIVESKDLFNNMELPKGIHNVTLNLKREPQCYEGQEISALMTGSYSSLLEYVYSQDKLIEDSIFHQLNHTEKQVVYLGEQTFWQDIFPHMTHSDYNHERDLKKILTTTNSFKVDFVIEDECSIYGSRQSRIRAYSNSEFQSIVELSDLEREEIDVTSTISAIMGIPIPFCNFGQVIPELYSKHMDLELNEEQYSTELRTWYTVFFHILLNAHQMEHYITRFQQYYPIFFDTDKVISLKGQIDKLQQIFSNIVDEIQPGQQGSQQEEKVIQKIKEQIKIQREVMKEVELAIQQSNFGQIHLMIISFIFFIVSFSYLLISEFKNYQNLQLFSKFIKSAFYYNHTSPIKYNFNIILTFLLGFTFIFIRNAVDIILHGMLLLNLDQEKIKKYVFLSALNILINARCLGIIKIKWAIKLADTIGVHSIFDIMSFLVIVFFAYKVLSTIYYIEIEFLQDAKKRRLFKILIYLSLINIIISGMQYFFNSIISHDSASLLIIIFFALVSSILIRPFVDKTDDFNKLNCEAKWILVSVNVLPLIFLDTHNEHIFIILILYLFQLFNFFHLIKNAGYLNSSMQVGYLIFLTIVIFQKGLLGSIEMGSLKNAIHIDHHHQHEESNIVIQSSKHNDSESDGNILYSFISNCIQIGAAPIILGGIFPVFQKIANKAKTIPREKFQNQSILKLLFDQDNFLCIENNYISSLQNLITYLLLLIIMMSFRIIYILLNLTFTYTSNFNSFRFYKEIFVFEMINYIFIQITILGCIHLFVKLNQNDQKQYQLTSQAEQQPPEKSKIKNPLSFPDNSESEFFNVSSRMVREDSLNEQTMTQDDEL